MASLLPCNLVWLAFFATVALLPCVTPRPLPSSVDDTAWSQFFEQWMGKHGREYRDLVEKAYRYSVFRSNVDYIDWFNRNTTHKYKLGINRFADLTVEEFAAMMNNTRGRLPREQQGDSSFRYANSSNVPVSVDWRLKGAVTPIKNQGNCGSCAVFTAVATIESVNKISTGRLVPLSEQELMDCSPGNVCKGTSAPDVYGAVIKMGGLVAESSYPPYSAKDRNRCDKRKASHPVASIRGYEYVPENDEGALKRAVANQPVYVVIEIGSHEFDFFSGTGVFDGPCRSGKKKENGLHAVAVIGYGAESDGTKYWLIKNSWGTDWGDGGFGKMARETGDAQGICGIAAEAVFPIA